MDLPNLPHATSTIARFLFPDIKSTLQLALSCAGTFSPIAKDATLWRSLYIHNERADDGISGTWAITDCPELVAVLNSPEYTDHTRKIGSGRTQHNVWFRCAMMMAMECTAGIIPLERHIVPRGRDESHPPKGLSPSEVFDSTVSKLVENGQWDLDFETLSSDKIVISPKHSIAYRQILNNSDWGWSYSDDFAKFVDYPLNHPQLLSLKFGD
ncbi:hypothetical protein HK097_003138 [Rhizophlyctis rosea]|uniref:Uncharacterized protein n=1 Tax=Rhizophlyctis rosea TaxID=64517 RepID=A0AAD5SG22_9FUNG|nr:hypothetical protein HK097_003138 [Rhizophlyctis rosea]